MTSHRKLTLSGQRDPPSLGLWDKDTRNTTRHNLRERGIYSRKIYTVIYASRWKDSDGTGYVSARPTEPPSGADGTAPSRRPTPGTRPGPFPAGGVPTAPGSPFPDADGSARPLAAEGGGRAHTEERGELPPRHRPVPAARGVLTEPSPPTPAGANKQ